MERTEDKIFRFLSRAYPKETNAKELALQILSWLKENNIEAEKDIVGEYTLSEHGAWWINFQMGSDKYCLLLCFDEQKNDWILSLHKRDRFRYSLKNFFVKNWLNPASIDAIRRTLKQEDIYNLKEEELIKAGAGRGGCSCLCDHRQQIKTEDIIGALERLHGEYPLKYTIKGDMIHFVVEGIADEFRSSVLGDECVVSTEAWHEHFSTAQEMEAFMKSLFTGRAEIIVAYRGDNPVSHRVQIEEEGKDQIVSRTGSLFSPFWKPKIEKKMEYRISKSK